MASLDVRDVLDLPQDGGAGVLRPSKKQKTAAHAGAVAARNLKGLAREVQSLGGENPIAIVPRMLSSVKKRRLASRKPAARWEMRPFRNSARADGTLVLRHWRRQQPQQQQFQMHAQSQATTEGGEQAAPSQDATTQDTNTNTAQTPDGAAASQPNSNSGNAALEDSGFAKFNVKVEVPEYTDDQYNTHLQNPEWTKEETDYLFELVRDFDLRWPLIWDRYDYRPPEGDAAMPDAAADATALVASTAAPGTPASTRTMEDLKARYYEVAAKMMEVHKPAQYMTQSEYNLHSTMANFNAEKERLRKAFVTNTLTRSREEVREEEALLLEVRRIMARVERTNEERRELYSRLDFPIADQDISSFKTSTGLQQLLQTMMYNNEKSKKRKSLAAAEAGGAGTSSPAPGGQAGYEGGGRGGAIGAGNGAASRRESGVGADGRGDGVSGTPTSATGRGGTPAGGATGGVVGAGGHAGGGKGGKKGGAPMERRKLTPQEQEVYGVSTHERLGSGPMFRYEKINKLFTHKSGQQQMRITNILNELDMPARLFMPTAAVTAQFEQLVNAVVQLVDMRKVSDKLDGEIKIEELRKAERDKARAVLGGGSADVAEQSEKLEKPEKQEKAEKADKAESAPRSTRGAAAVSADAKDAGAASTADAETKAKAEADANGNAEAKDDAGDEDGDGGEEDNDGDGEDGGGGDDDDDDTALESGGNRLAVAGGESPQKRSASVLSGTSDKSAKRQRK